MIVPLGNLITEEGGYSDCTQMTAQSKKYSNKDVCTVHIPSRVNMNFITFCQNERGMIVGLCGWVDVRPLRRNLSIRDYILSAQSHITNACECVFICILSK